MKNIFLLIVSCIFFSNLLFAQSVGINNNAPDASAILDVKSGTKGMLIPRTSTPSRLAILNPAKGLMLYDTTTSSFWFYNGTAWGNLSASGIGGSGTSNYLSKFSAFNSIGNSQLFDNGTNVGINTVSPFAKLHIKGSADVPQLFIDANATQSNSNPLITLRRSDGVNLMSIHSDNPFNTFVGLYAGSVNNAPGGGLYNTFIGRDAGASNTTGSANTAEGFQALQLNATGLGNTANGAGALQSNIIGNENTAFGALALQNSIASLTTAIGFKALWLNTNGFANTAIGHSALLNNNGSYNTAIGHKALYSNINASSNTATGDRTLYSNTSGYSNTGDGTSALYFNTIGYENTAIGMKSLGQNTTASRNTAIGVNALYTQSYNYGGVSWESGNVAVGYNALYLNQPTIIEEGYENTAVGSYAMQGNTRGYNNTAFGYGSLVSNNTGTNNTASGHNALHNNTTGYYNVAIGNDALYYNTVGIDNIAIGANSGTAVGSPNISNTVSIGNWGWANAASNQVFLGNASSSWIGGWKDWSRYSDERMKNRISNDVKGLDFIKRLRPVTYYTSIKTATELTGNKETADYPEKYEVEKIRQSGFLAQEVEKAAIESGYDFNGVHKPKNEHDLYSLSYATFVVPLVKAMQEQQAIIDMLQMQVEAAKAEIPIQIGKQQAMIEDLKNKNEAQNKKIEFLLKEMELIKNKLK